MYVNVPREFTNVFPELARALRLEWRSRQRGEVQADRSYRDSASEVAEHSHASKLPNYHHASLGQAASRAGTL